MLIIFGDFCYSSKFARDINKPSTIGHLKYFAVTRHQIKEDKKTEKSAHILCRIIHRQLAAGLAGSFRMTLTSRRRLPPPYAERILNL
jgi:hypothetical protein